MPNRPKPKAAIPATPAEAEVPERVDILGVGVDPLDLDGAVRRVAAWIERGESNYVCVTGVHGVMESRRDAGLRAIHNRAGMVTADGMPLVWLSRRRGHTEAARVYGPDLMLRTFAQSETTSWRHFLYGSTDTCLGLLEANLRKRYPRAEIVGIGAPPFGPITGSEWVRDLARIRATRPDIVWVGLSTPKQEQWMARAVSELDAVLVGVGAAFDFHAGLKRQAPRWMQRSGLEWAFRLASEPRRLAGRYLRNNPRFITALIAHRLVSRGLPARDRRR